MSPPPRPARLILRGLSHTYPRASQPRPQEASGEVRSGEWVCVAGPNGCGKSTLLRLAAGLLPPASGEVWIEPPGPGPGTSPLRPGERAFRRALGYLSQLGSEQVLGSTVGDELAAALEWHGVPRPEIQARVAEALRGLGGEEWRGRTASALSLGERRRVALTAVTLPRPLFLLADEPLGDLDPIARAEWLGRLAELKAAGLGVLTAATSAAEASRADRVWLLESGRRGLREVAPAEVLDPAVARAAGLRPAPPQDLDFSALGRAAACRPPDSPEARAALVGARLERGGVALWEALDLGVPARGLTALFGLNGAGKSSLGLVLAGLHRPAAGQVRGALGWERVAGARRCHSALAFQCPEDQLGLGSVREELTPAAGGRARSTPEELLARVGLAPGEFLGRPPQELSAGERRRVALAALAALEPELLVLDEPLSGLDGPGVAWAAGWIAAEARERAVWVLSSDLDVPELPVECWLGVRRGAALEARLDGPRLLDSTNYLPWAYGSWLTARRDRPSPAGEHP
ncbi:MAG TPA: ABC transporter ATP-binding protein [Candidatus Saccharimonadales bacterium]|nr:ABC transporter ATP-binding protein [Candidatus Saccharimonadales bacterium]